MRSRGLLLTALWLGLGAIWGSGLAGAQIVVDDRLVETKADGVCSGLLTLSTSQRYIDCLNGTIYDTFTGLLWLHDASCAALGTQGDGTANWADAMEAAAQVAHGLDCDSDGTADLTDGSQPSDWRLPTRWEWFQTTLRAKDLGCVDGSFGGPALTNHEGDDCFAVGSGSPPFSGVIQNRDYWSSTSPSSAPTLAVGWSLLDAAQTFLPKSIVPPLPLVWPVRLGLDRDTGSGAAVEGSPVETGTDGSCSDDLGLGAERHVNCGDGTVLDTLTQLVWLRDATCSSLPGGGVGDYLDATDAVADLGDGTCGLTDGSQPGSWRLPTRDEWSAATARAEALGCTNAGAGEPPALTDTAGTGCLAAGATVFIGIPPSPRRFWTSQISSFVPSLVTVYSLNEGSFSHHQKSQSAGLWAWPVRPRKTP